MMKFMIKSVHARVLLCAALVCFAFASSAFADAVVNGGFETGDFTGWTVNDTSNFTNIGPNPLFAHSGTFHANLGAEGVLGSLSQNLSTTPGGTYTLSFWLANDSGAATNEFDVLWGGTPIFTESNAPVSNYTEFTFTLAATGASTALEFDYRNDDDFFRLDDVSVNIVPEPSVMWLALLGASLLCFARYRGAKHRRLLAAE